MDYLQKNADRLIIDADTHITDIDTVTGWVKERMKANPNYFHGRPMSAEYAIRQMKLSEVDMALCWQNPATTMYTKDTSFNYDSLLAANRYITDTGKKYQQRFIPAAWTDPNALGVRKAIDLALQCIHELGVGIVKINPAQNKFPINSGEVLEVVEAVIDAGAIIAFHYGADTPYTPPEGLEDVAKRFPDSPFIAVHMGGGGATFEDSDEMYTASRDLGMRRMNIRFVESAKRDVHIESDFIEYQKAGSPLKEHIFCGSDAPYGNQLFHFAGYRSMLKAFLEGKDHHDERIQNSPDLFDEASIQGYLGGNFARFIVSVYENLLKVNAE